MKAHTPGKSLGRCAGGFQISVNVACKKCGSLPNDICQEHYRQILEQHTELLAALTDLLVASEADAGRPGPDDADDEPVGWQGGNGAGGVNEQATPMALTFGMMRKARAAISKASTP